MADEQNAILYQKGIHNRRWVADKAGGMKLITVAKPAPMPPRLTFDELRNIASMGAMGNAILNLGIACGDLTQADVDSLYHRAAA